MPVDMRSLVIRPRVKRPGALYAGFGLAVVLLLWGTFEAGRAAAGFSVVRWFEQRRALAAELKALAQRNGEIEAQLAAAEIARRVDHEAYAEVEKSLADLQARLGEQSQELAFYRGIVSPAEGLEGLRVQRLLVLPGGEPHRYRVRVVLVQAARNDAKASGSVTLAVDGVQGGRALSLPFDEIRVADAPLPFAFRYFQEIETELRLPAEFTPQRVQVEVRSKSATAPVRQSFAWRVETV
jgi:hypothetical protein